jgi:hypothetical protein
LDIEWISTDNKKDNKKVPGVTSEWLICKHGKEPIFPRRYTTAANINYAERSV